MKSTCDRATNLTIAERLFLKGDDVDVPDRISDTVRTDTTLQTGSAMISEAADGTALSSQASTTRDSFPAPTPAPGVASGGTDAGRTETMTLGQALGHIKQRKEVSRRRQIFLVCGFQPLHLETFLQGYFALRFSDEAADIQVGLYGELERTLTAAVESRADAAAVIIEWSDLDPRLGLRSAGGWALSMQADILQSCRESFTRLLSGLQALGAKMPVAVISPTLPFIPLGHTASWQLSPNEAELHRELGNFLAQAAGVKSVAVLNPASLAGASPSTTRSDVFMELKAGFPYTVVHASAVANQAVKLLFPPPPMKGLITDLDDTFWSGIVGEIGAGSVSWSLAEHTQIHGLYQQMLAHLAEMGVLLAIASKNELSVVEQALERDDLLVPSKSLFPVHASWGSKPASVAEILRTWNIGAHSVVFVDDSGMELDEVKTAFPQITCLQFSKKQPAKVMALLEQLRDLFGKPSIQQEDTLRQASIRANAAIHTAAGSTPDSAFLSGLQGRLTFDFRKDASNTRLLELVNKTNQFNLNGVRVGEGEWSRLLKDERAQVMAVSYEDKFGPLGAIGVLSGRQTGGEFEVISWVLSCRAFSRMIEHQMLHQLFRHKAVDTVRMAFMPTPRNQPLQNFLKSLGLNIEASGSLSISREQFENKVEELPHQVRLRDS